MKSIFEFLDYRLYLKDYYQDRKAADKGYTFRRMAKQMGFGSSNYLMLVMQGKRNVGKESLEKIAKGLDLGKKEAEYFSYLAFFDQAKTNVEKNYFFALIASFRTKSQVVKLHADKFNYYDQWYNPVLREIVKRRRADADPKEIAQSVSPPILPKEARKSLALLRDLGLLKVEHGRFAQSADLIHTDREVQSLAVRNFHKKMSDLAKEAIDNVDPLSREISSLTLRISEKGFEGMKKRLQEFREELLQMVRGDSGDDRVYQLNFQFFPVSKIPLQEDP
jgi:uncharacterized protein (TIGR02147 family)